METPHRHQENIETPHRHQENMETPHRHQENMETPHRHQENRETPHRHQENMETPHRHQENMETPHRHQENRETPHRHQENIETPHRHQENRETPHRHQENMETPHRHQENMETPHRHQENRETPHRHQENIETPHRHQENMETPHRHQENMETPHRHQENRETPHRHQENRETPHRHQENIETPHRHQENIETPQRHQENMETPHRHQENMETPHRHQENRETPRRHQENMGTPHRHQENRETPHRHQENIETPHRHQENMETPRRHQENRETPHRHQENIETPHRHQENIETPYRHQENIDSTETPGEHGDSTQTVRPQNETQDLFRLRHLYSLRVPSVDVCVSSGVCQLVNKMDEASDSVKAFNRNDEQFLEAFAIFCGLGIQNTQMYETVERAMAKQEVTLEVLSYHATASEEESRELQVATVPSAQSLRLLDFSFSDFELSDTETTLATIRMFVDLNLVQNFQMKYMNLCRWVLSVKKNYRKSVAYHNWRHAFNTAQSMFALLKSGRLQNNLNDLEVLALMIATLSHDLDHRGVNNSYIQRSDHPLAQLYCHSTMEHHHFDHCLMILNSPGNQILSSLSLDEYKSTLKMIERAILATDLALYMKRRGEFFELTKNSQFVWEDEQHRDLLRSMLMTACDISAITKPWPVQQRVKEPKLF
ncbi:cGMP-specific 3',5'-cyclic phosphodiesterase [Takifugu flavidus]|uniref:Phosphodiesterase n=1 Tax=Takifugu flavidus TaxID=433684 RepID=A0A5C6NAB4_9TELE|nr:cGMP-specific 3',5'-cyclic phosphodiesterase [Takifugu flavidus]